MKWASYRANGKQSYGIVKDREIVDVGGVAGQDYPTLRSAIAGERLDELARRVNDKALRYAVPDVEFLPVLPDADKVIAIGRNYKSHIDEVGSETPKLPVTFFKHMTSFVGHEASLICPKLSNHFDYEGELAVVIGKRCRHISREQALDMIAGYTCLNDGSLRDIQKQCLNAGKNFTASSSMGPWMVTADEIPDPTVLCLTTLLNDKEVQRSGTDLLIYDIPYLINYLSQWTELLPGDVIATGTPGGVGQKRNPPLWMKAGDVIEVSITQIGSLRNGVVAERT